MPWRQLVSHWTSYLLVFRTAVMRLLGLLRALLSANMTIRPEDIEAMQLVDAKEMAVVTPAGTLAPDGTLVVPERLNKTRKQGTPRNLKKSDARRYNQRMRRRAIRRWKTHQAEVEDGVTRHCLPFKDFMFNLAVGCKDLELRQWCQQWCDRKGVTSLGLTPATYWSNPKGPTKPARPTPKV